MSARSITTQLLPNDNYKEVLAAHFKVALIDKANANNGTNCLSHSTIEGFVSEESLRYLQERVCAYASHKHPAKGSRASDAYLRIGNLMKELRAPEMSYSTFVKGMAIIGVNVTLTSNIDD